MENKRFGFFFFFSIFLLYAEAPPPPPPHPASPYLFGVEEGSQRQEVSKARKKYRNKWMWGTYCTFMQAGWYPLLQKSRRFHFKICNLWRLVFRTIFFKAVWKLRFWKYGHCVLILAVLYFYQFSSYLVGFWLHGFSLIKISCIFAAWLAPDLLTVKHINSLNSALRASPPPRPSQLRCSPLHINKSMFLFLLF